MAAETNAWLEGQRVDVTELRREDVIGIGHVLTEIDGLVARLRDPARAEAMGVEMPRGMLFHGDPGLGKTLVARMVATSLGEGVPFYEVSADQLTPERIRSSLRYLAEAHPRSVLYIDEIDNFGMARDYGGHDPRTRQMLTATLAALDGLVPTRGPLVIASSNRGPHHLDKALVRAGRLGFKVKFDHPDEGEREQLLRLFARPIPQSRTMRWAEAARLTRGATPADLRQLVADAAGLALARGQAKVGAADLLAAIRRSGRVEPESINIRDWHRMAVHEAGHVAVGAALRGAAWIYSVAIGPFAGHTAYGDELQQDEDRPDDETRDVMAVAFGGVAAEIALLGEAGSGGGTDISNCTNLALERFVAGLTDDPAPVDLNHFGRNPPASVKEAQAAQARAAIKVARSRAQAIVEANVPAIEAFAAMLERARELTGPHLASVIASSGFVQPPVPGNGTGPRLDSKEVARV